MTTKQVPLFERLPEIYRTKDAEQLPPDQLKSYLALVEEVFGAIHENIEALYHDLFIETCDEWVIPYIGDLLGTSHLSGDPWTLRADVADTIALRRRKGTLGAIELLAYDLTRWGVHSVELRENLVWSQHLNHQRPDEGGNPPYSLPSVNRFTPIRGGTVTLRNPATLSLLGTPFDPFAHMPDVKPPATGQIRYNLPNLAIFLWRLQTYRLSVTKPFTEIRAGASPDEAALIVRVNVNPIPVCALFVPPLEPLGPYVKPGNEPAGQPVRLFNTNRFDLSNRRREGIDKLNLAALPPRVTERDETPGPIPVERLTEADPDAAPAAYVSIEDYDLTDLTTIDLSDVGLQLHVPQPEFAGEVWPRSSPPSPWKIRGANLCAWENGLAPALADHEVPIDPVIGRIAIHEVAIDPVIGRIAIGVESAAEADVLAERLLVTYTYGAPGPVGAHPIDYPALPKEWRTPEAEQLQVNFDATTNDLHAKLSGIRAKTQPVVIEINDSRTHVLDLSALGGDAPEEGGLHSLLLNDSLIIRAADGERPIIELAQPLGFRPANVTGANIERLTVRLEGLFLARGSNFPKDEPLIARAALNRLELINCTLDPGGFQRFNGARAPVLTSLRLREPYGFANPDEERVFNQTPEIILHRTISGPLLLDEGYQLCLSDSIIDARQGVNDNDPRLAIGNATDDADYGPPLRVNGVTIFGGVRVASIDGSGGIFVHALEVLNNQIGCLKFSYFSGEEADRLPQNHGCVNGGEARLHFVSEIFGQPAYGQLAMSTDGRIRERGPRDDAMGAYGFLLEAHKWRNLQIRFREFMPVGVRPLLIPVT